MAALLTFNATLEDAGECPTCGVRFAIPHNLLASLRNSKAMFYCPNGHPQSFRQSRTEALEAELKAERERRERAEDLARRRREEADVLRRTKQQTLGKLRALKGRVKNGVCPCCNRSFAQLAKHIATKHPDYAKEQPETEPETEA